MEFPSYLKWVCMGLATVCFVLARWNPFDTGPVFFGVGLGCMLMGVVACMIEDGPGDWD